MIYFVHILAGSVALVSGYIALVAMKGARVHRKSGMAFVYAMLVMAILGAVIAALGAGEGSVIAGVTTAYLVLTAMITVKRPAAWSRRLDVALMLFALTVGSISFALGVDMVVGPNETRDGLPPFPFFMFGIVALLSGAGDARMIRIGGLLGAARLSRHLWRMCWAMWIAASSFFWGQQDIMPEAMRNTALLSIPVMIPIVLMLYWLWRLRRGSRIADRGSRFTNSYAASLIRNP